LNNGLGSKILKKKKKKKKRICDLLLDRRPHENPQVGHLMMAMTPVIMHIQAKLSFHPMGEKVESRESKNI
jgi:hypothetical protein